MNDLLADIDIEANSFNDLYPQLSNGCQSQYYNTDEFRIRIKKSRADLAVFHLNIRSQYAKNDDLKMMLRNLGCKFDFAGLTETWLTPSVPHMVHFPGCTMHSGVMKEGRRGGGVSILANDMYHCEELVNYTYCENHAESIFLRTSFQGKTLLIGCIYRPPDGNAVSFLECLENILRRLHGGLPEAKIILL